MLPKYRELFTRETEAIIHLSDVFSDPARDFDAELTAIFRNLGTLSDRTYFVGGNADLAGYGGVLLNDLVFERRRILSETEQLKTRQEKAVVIILNALPREGYDVNEFPNGRDFYLAITESGVEIFACPLATLSALESRNAIVALYRIPNAMIPFTNGNREQFRSSIIAASRYRTEVMEPVFEYDSVSDLVAAKEKGLHPNAIPEQKNAIEFAYADRFGNVRLSVDDTRELREQLNGSFGKKVLVTVGNADPFEAVYTDSLADIPMGALGLYENVADLSLAHRRPGYWELVKRTDHCLTEKETAFAVLQQKCENVWGISFRIQKM